MGIIRRIRQSLSQRGDRGAALIEYSLVVGLVVMGSTASFEMMDERVEANYSQTAQDIGQVDLSSFSVTTTTTTTAPPTTTTAPPTTTTTTTTTTAPPTTTTTVASSGEAEIKWKDKSYENFKGWVAKARIKFLDENGDPMVGAVVQVTITLDDGSTKVKTSTVTNNKGNKSFAWSGLDDDDFEVTFTIDSILYNGQNYIPDDPSFEVEADD